MTIRPSICVFHVPPYHPNVATGGAEVVATEIVTSLASVADVTVLCGYDPDASPAQVLDATARVLHSFPLGDAVWYRGCIAPDFTDTARQHLAAADRGRPYAQEHYNIARTRAEYREAALTLVARKHLPRSGDRDRPRSSQPYAVG